MDNKYLLLKNNQIYKLLDNGIYKTNIIYDELTEDIFEEIGTSSIDLLNKYFTQEYKILMMSNRENNEQEIFIDGFKDLISNNFDIVKILIMGDKENNEQEFSIDGTKDLRVLGCNDSKILVAKDKTREDIPLALPYGYTSPQLIIPTGDIRLQKVSKINSLQIKANDDEELVRIIYSINGGDTWHSKKPNQPVKRNFLNNLIDIKNIDDIIKNGMTIKEFNSINEGWTEEILKNGKIRFAYLLQFDDIRTKSEVDELEINMSMYGSWLSQVHDEEFNYEYDNDKLILKVYNDGTYKFNYFG